MNTYRARSSRFPVVTSGSRWLAGVGLQLFLLISVLTSSPAHAQSYSIDLFTVSGGGGTSAGGRYSVSGNVGQTDAGPTLTGGSFAVTGGFWTLVEVMQTAGAPPLRIRQEGLNVVISWPNPSTGFVLQQTTDLDFSPSEVVWTDIDLLPTESGLEKSATIPVSPGHRFFRLKRP